MSLSSVVRSLVVVLSAVGYATAQIPLGVQMVPNPELPGYSDPAPAYSSDYPSDPASSYPSDPAPSYYNAPAPSYPTYPSYPGSNSYSAPPVETGSPSYSAPPSQYTPPPAESSGSYEPMPYSSFTNGGYSQMDCGYGYQKGYDGKCTPESWVRPLPFLFPNTHSENKPTERCGIFADRACVFFLVGRQQ